MTCPREWVKYFTTLVVPIKFLAVVLGGLLRSGCHNSYDRHTFGLSLGPPTHDPQVDVILTSIGLEGTEDEPKRSLVGTTVPRLSRYNGH
jgi:hypothetical protein